MKKLLLTTVLIFAGLSNPALAGNTIPAAFHGEWCSLNGTYLLPRAAIEATPSDARGDRCSRDSDGWIKITANRYDGWEQKCKPVNVTKVSGDFPTYVIKLKCTVEADEKIDLVVEIKRTPSKYGLGKRLYVNTR
jgi:hypothetical protein